MADLVKMHKRSALVKAFQVNKDPYTIAGFQAKLSMAMQSFIVSKIFN
jgi:hypothetical protein